jgi:DNA-binding NarL/FixJ family response regulator
MALAELTQRETEVLAKLAEGLTVKEVATALDVSWDTVRNHVANIYSKLHVHSRSEAILKYLGRGPGD